MSQARKMLKIISFIQVVAALWAIVAGIMFFASGDAEGPFGLEPSTFRILGLLISVAAAILSFLAAAQGIKGANVPSRLGSHLQLNIACIVAGLVDFALFFETPSPNAGTAGICVLVVAAYAISRGIRVRKELDR